MTVTDAYVLIECERGKARQSLQEIRRFAGVKEAHLVTGPHDIMCFVETSDLNTAGNLVLDQIQMATGVWRTETLMVVGD